MAMKRIVNKTPRTRVLVYGDHGQYNLTLKKFGTTVPLPENHRLLTDDVLTKAIAAKHVEVIDEADYQRRVGKIKQEIQKMATDDPKKRMIDEQVKREKERTAAMEHNRRAEAKKEAEVILNKGVARNQVAVESIIEDEEMKTVPVPPSMPPMQKEDTNREAVNFAATTGLDDQDHEELVKKSNKKKNKKNKRSDEETTLELNLPAESDSETETN
jgi:hypothetical protein